MTAAIFLFIVLIVTIITMLSKFLQFLHSLQFQLFQRSKRSCSQPSQPSSHSSSIHSQQFKHYQCELHLRLRHNAVQLDDILNDLNFADSELAAGRWPVFPPSEVWDPMKTIYPTSPETGFFRPLVSSPRPANGTEFVPPPPFNG